MEEPVLTIFNLLFVALDHLSLCLAFAACRILLTVCSHLLQVAASESFESEPSKKKGREAGKKGQNGKSGKGGKAKKLTLAESAALQVRLPLVLPSMISGVSVCAVLYTKDNPALD